MFQRVILSIVFIFFMSLNALHALELPPDLEDSEAVSKMLERKKMLATSKKEFLKANKDGKSVPSYIRIQNGERKMRFAVLNRTSRVSSKLLNKVLDVIKTQTEDDFSPFYGISAEFVVFEKGKEPSNWHNFVPLILVDELLPKAAAVSQGAIAFHAVQSNAVQNPATLWANAIEPFIKNPPKIPNGLPYIIVPMGSSSAGYGVVFAAHLHLRSLPPTFKGILSSTISHEVLETLLDSTLNLWTTNFGRTDNPNHFIISLEEPCDPVEFTRGYRSKKHRNLFLSNFVLPSFWNPYGGSFGPFDFLNTVQKPLTPFAGETTEILINDKGEVKFIFLVSTPGNPTRVIKVDGGPVFTK